MPNRTHAGSCVLVAEPARPGWGHASFNAAMLRGLLELAGADGMEIRMFAERTHREALVELLGGSCGIAWEEISVLDAFDGRFFRKFAVELRALYRVLREAKRSGSDVILLSVFSNALAALMLLKPLFRGVNVHVILHGELESLLERERQPVYKQGFWTSLAILRLFRGSWPKLYVLGEGIRSRLLGCFPQHRQLTKVRAIRHPNVFGTGREQRERKTGPFRVGFIGVGRLIKGVAEFFELARQLGPHVEVRRVEFMLVGGLEPRASALVDSRVQVLGNRVGALAGENYSAAIAELDCAVFLARHNYRLTASGSIFDAIDKDLEILSLENFYFRDLAKLDSEGGIKFFSDLSGIAEEITSRIVSGRGFQRFRYARIKAEYSAEVRNALTEALSGAHAARTYPSLPSKARK